MVLKTSPPLDLTADNVDLRRWGRRRGLFSRFAFILQIRGHNNAAKWLSGFDSLRANDWPRIIGIFANGFGSWEMGMLEIWNRI